MRYILTVTLFFCGGLVLAAAAPGDAPLLFQKPIPASQIAFLAQEAGVPTASILADKRFRKLLDEAVPDAMFHYGRDMPLPFALEETMKKSAAPAQVRDGRYLLLSSSGAGRAFIWVDLQDGIALGGIFFHPSNGEPTPTLTVFSRQLKTSSLAMSQLPAAFATDLEAWQRQYRVPEVSPRYFITGDNSKILLEHDGDFCASAATPAPDCAVQNADAANADLNAAYYVEQTHHATNATARMIFDPEQLAWGSLRDRTCAAAGDPVLCRFQMTRERVRIVVHHAPVRRSRGH